MLYMLLNVSSALNKGLVQLLDGNHDYEIIRRISKQRKILAELSNILLRNASIVKNPSKNLRFHIVDCVDNVEGFTVEKIDELLLEKEKMWIRNLLTVHKGLNSSHDLNRKKRHQIENLD